MDFRYTFLVSVMCLLVKVDARPSWSRTANPRPISLQSFLRTKDHCQAGNLLQIHFDGGKTQAKCDGRSTESATTKFTIVDIGNKKCIQYIDTQGGDPSYYALKVFDKTTVTFVNERCNSSTADAFLFDEERKSPFSRNRYYKHTLNNTSLYLGVNWNCTGDGLSLICNQGDRRCIFEWA